MINETLKFKIKSNHYEISDVRIGHFIDFERLKATLSAGMYGSIFRMGTRTGDEALTMIDIEAFFTVFCPKLMEDLQCKSFKELGLVDYMSIKEVYTEKIIPWYNEYIKLLDNRKDDVKAEK